MCREEGVNLQRGMNYRLQPTYSVLLMSTQPNAPYADQVEDSGRTLVYEGHDLPRSKDGPDPKTIDQPLNNPSGSLTQNGLFFDAAQTYKNCGTSERVKVYEKIRPGTWVYNGLFQLVDAWQEESGHRLVCKFKLLLVEECDKSVIHRDTPVDLAHTRMIPSRVKHEVWKRDGGKCVECGATDNLHFDHIIPFSKGGSSLTTENIQLLCARHNLRKHDHIK